MLVECCLTLFRMGIFRAAHPKICHTYPTMMKLGTVIPYPKKIQKIYESRDTPLEFCWHQHFSPEISKFCYIKKCRYRLHFGPQFNFFNFCWVFKDFLNKTGYNFDDVSKKGYLGLLKINIFWNKGYDIIIPVDDITNKIL